MNLLQGNLGRRRKLAISVIDDALQRILYLRSTGTPQEHLDRINDLIGPRAMRALGAVGDTIELLLGNPVEPVASTQSPPMSMPATIEGAAHPETASAAQQ